MEEIFWYGMKYGRTFMVCNEKKCRYRIWKNHLPFHYKPRKKVCRSKVYRIIKTSEKGKFNEREKTLF